VIRLGHYARALGQAAGARTILTDMLMKAAPLHDIGKVGVPAAVLRKTGALTVPEREQMQRHPEIGARLLSRIDGLRAAAPFVLHHQERWDGARDGQFPGYPSGLRGEEIPLGARIIAVVDAFDAMTTDRPYRLALSEGEAREALRAERGRQFDPRVVEVFLTLLGDRPWQ
jgi:putative two-component system response regulator